MKQLVDCVGMSERKKVLESGRRLRVIGLTSLLLLVYRPGETVAVVIKHFAMANMTYPTAVEYVTVKCPPNRA